MIDKSIQATPPAYPVENNNGPSCDERITRDERMINVSFPNRKCWIDLIWSAPKIQREGGEHRFSSTTQQSGLVSYSFLWKHFHEDDHPYESYDNGDQHEPDPPTARFLYVILEPFTLHF